VRKLWGIFAFILLVLPATAQPGSDEEDYSEEALKNYIIEQRIELIGENLDVEDADYTTLFDDLAYFYDRNLNLNAVTIDELNRLRLLTSYQIEQLLQHIEENGKLVVIYELQSINGFDMNTINDILPFVKVSSDLDAPHISFKELMSASTNELFLRYSRVLEEQTGFSAIEDSVLAESPNRRYLGDPNKLYLRYRYKFRQNISIGVTAEKDAGEEFGKGSNPNGFDYYSAHIFIRDFGAVKAVALGDYQLQFGQGLTAWTGIAYGKSAAVMTLKRNAQGLKAYTSVDENRFLRGAAATVGVKDFEFTAFYSKKQIDANISQPDTFIGENQLTVTSFQSSGFHSTPSEIEDENAIGERIMGGRFAFRKRRIQIGVTGVHSEYNGVLNRNLTYYNQFDFNSNENTVFGADYSVIYKNFNFFGEISRSANGGIAYLNGALIALDPKVSFSVYQRHFGRDFQNLISNAVGESSTNRNEDGLYFGLEARPNRKWTLSAYYDMFRFDWLRNQVDAPSNGYEYLSQLNYKPSRKLNMYFRIRHRERPINTNDPDALIDFVETRFQTNYRFHVSYTVSDNFRLGNRVEMIDYKEGNGATEKGFLIYQDITYKKKGTKWSLKARYALFESDSYDARIYAYESDVLYAFSIPAYAFRGSRSYLVFRYTPRRGIDIWLRYSRWDYNDRQTISSGLPEILGSTKSEIKAQVRFKF